MNKPIKILELFAGIGAPRRALENVLGVDQVHSVDFVENDKKAVEAYNLLFNTGGKVQDIRDYNRDIDLLVHGSPCQDFSIAGKGKGGEEGSNTRSSLLFNVIDLIKKEVNKPKVVIWENVPSVLFKKHKPVFNRYLELMKYLGYKNQWKILNGVDFGIPQKRRRVFVVSTFDNNYSHFDIEKLKLTKTKELKHFLDSNWLVNSKYFITQHFMINAIKNKKVKIVDNVVNTITTKQMRWNNSGVLKVEYSKFNQENYFFNSSSSIIPTITANGANSKLKIAFPRSNFNNDESKNYLVFIIDDIPYHMRVLTPLETMKLMGFTLSDYFKLSNNLSSNVIYKLAGNSIIVPILESIFEALFLKEKNEKSK